MIPTCVRIREVGKSRYLLLSSVRDSDAAEDTIIACQCGKSNCIAQPFFAT